MTMKRKMNHGFYTHPGGQRVAYWLNHAPISDEFPHMDSKKVVWHLWLHTKDEGYVGHFETRKEADSYIVTASLA